MENDYVEDFFECVYNHELDQKHKLESSDSLIIGVLGALSGVAAYYIDHLTSAESNAFSIVFGFVSLSFMVILGVGIWYAILSIWPKKRGFIASTAEWAEFVSGVEVYHRHYQKSEDAIKEKVALDLAEARRKQYVEAGEVNRAVIIKKAAYQTTAKKCIAIAVVLMLLNTIPLYFMLCRESKLKEAANKQSTRNETSETYYSFSQIQVIMPDPNRPQPPREQQAPKKPEPPKVVIIREDQPVVDKKK